MSSGFVTWIGLFLLASVSMANTMRGGLPVASGHYPELVVTNSGNLSCTGTIVGPRAVILAAHCIDPKNPLVTFSYEGTIYNAIGIISDAYESKNHDLAIAVSLTDIQNVRPISVLTAPLKNNIVIRIISHGCSENGEISSEFDTLRIGDTVIQSFKDVHMTFKTLSDSTSCFAAAGAPSNCYSPTDRYISGVSTTSPNGTVLVRMDTPDTWALFQRVTKTFKAKICGHSLVCENHQIFDP